MRCLLASVLVLGLACDGATDAPDAAFDANDANDAADASAPVVAAPLPPALPSHAPCFEGFREVVDDAGVTICEPGPASGRPLCGPGDAHFPGRPGCERIGSECPSSGFADGLPGSGVVYVQGGASGGDGSLAAPFGSIGEALAIAADGDTIALSAGTWSEEIVLDRPIHLVGACAAETILTSSVPSVTAGVVTIDGPGVVVENLQIAGSARSALWIEGAAAEAVVRNVFITDVTGIGIDVERGATARVERVAIRDVALSDVAPFVGYLGRGINVETGSSATLDTVTVEGAHEFGVLGFAEGTVVAASRLAIARMGTRADGTAGPALMSLGGARVEVRGLWIDESIEFGAAAGGAGSELAIEDALITRTAMSAAGVGRGLNVQDGAGARCARCRILDIPEAAILAGQSSTVELVDLVIATSPFGSTRRGVEVQRGAAVTVERALLVDTGEIAIFVDGEDSVLTGTDLTVERVSPIGAGILGRAATAQNGGSITLERGFFRDVADVALAVAFGASAEVNDLTIRHVSPWESGEFGRGVIVQASSSLHGARIDVEDTFDIGVTVLTDSDLTVDDLRVANNRSARCATTTCLSLPGGHGFGVYDSTATIDGLELSDHDVCGIHVAESGRASIRSGLVTHNAIGACVQSEAQELGALQDDVYYLDNDVNLQATMLPIPMPSTNL